MKILRSFEYRAPGLAATPIIIGVSCATDHRKVGLSSSLSYDGKPPTIGIKVTIQVGYCCPLLIVSILGGSTSGCICYKLDIHML